MKKLIAILICAMLILLPALALAEAPIEDALPDRAPAAGDTIELEIEGERVLLDFDTSSQYSSIEDGQVQASFYKYSDDGATLYELYIIFPDTAQAGMVITPEYAALTNEESSVVLIVSDTQTQQEQYYFSSLMDGGVYPGGSDYTIAIDDVYEIDGGTTYKGRLSATLVALNMSTGDIEATLAVPETAFSFTLGGTSERHADPLPTETPDDMRKV